MDFNIAFGPSATKYDQDLAVFSQMFDLSPDSADTDRDVRDRAEDIQRSRGAILALLNGPDGNPGTADDYDAFLASGNNLAGTPAKAGFPSIVVPGGVFQNVVTPAFPAGFNAKDGPAGVTFSGRAFSEPPASRCEKTLPTGLPCFPWTRVTRGGTPTTPARATSRLTAMAMASPGEVSRSTRTWRSACSDYRSSRV